MMRPRSGTSTPAPRHAAARLAALAFTTVAIACGDAAPALGEAAAFDAAPGGRASADAVASAPLVAPEMSSMRSRSAEVTKQAGAERDRVLRDSTAGQMLIRTGFVSVRVDSLEPAMAALRSLAQRMGGMVGNVSISSGDYAVRSATLELRVPAGRFDEVMGGIRPLGKVEQQNVTAEDVGEEFVDVRARVQNARRLEQRLVDLLATRTGKLEDVLAVERELARVREEIERHEARLRWLGAHVALSTINVTLSEPAPVVGDTPGRNVLGQAFVQAWRNFVGLVAWTIESLGVLVPVAVVLLLAARWWRGRRAGRHVDG